MNLAILMGSISQVEQSVTHGGDTIATFIVTTSSTYQGRTKTREVVCAAFRETAEKVLSIPIGSYVKVDGRLDSRLTREGRRYMSDLNVADIEVIA